MSAFPGQLLALLSPRAYPHPVRRVELIETHVSWVLLTGEFAYKIKRPVLYTFVDQRSLERRRFFCHEEVRLNRRFAPEMYLAVCPISVRAGAAEVDGPGPVIEYAVRMREFPRTDELDQLLAAGRVEPAELRAFGSELARIHAQLPAAQPDDGWARPEALSTLILSNAAECSQAGKTLGTRHDLRALQAALGSLAESTLSLRVQRRADGRVRECHGDLHTRNIARYGARLLAFDALEFDPALRWIDVADEISFLLVDLETRQCPVHAQAFLAGYLTESGDYQTCALLPLFKAHHALVRAKIAALGTRTAAANADRGSAPHEYEAYVESARHTLAAKRPVLVLMCGLSGSGKTWLAQRLAPALSAVHLRSDIERKRLAGLSPTDRSKSAAGEGLYAPDASRTVYRRLAECAADTLTGGYTTIVDATFGRAAERAAFRDLAQQRGVELCVVYCVAAREVLEARIVAREGRGDDASEADLPVLAWQGERFEPPGPHEASTVLEWQTPEEGAVEALARRITSLGAGSKPSYQ